MKKAYLIFILLINVFGARFSLGQPLPGRPGSYIKMGVVKIKQPLLVIGTLETNYSSLVIDPQNLDIVQVYQDSIQLASFGAKGRDGVILAGLKKKVPLLRLEEVLDYFKVPAANRTLKVMINNALVNPVSFLADVQRIKKIEKVKQDPAAPYRYSFNMEEEYLNIITVKD